MQIVKPDSQRFFHGMIYGPAGQGKTTLLATANEDDRTRPILILDTERGTSSLAGTDTDVVYIETMADIQEVINYLSNSKHPYKSIALDSITETQNKGLLEILKKEGVSRKDPDAFQQQDWGKILVQMRRMVRQITNLPLHCFFTALSKDDIDPREGSIKKPRFQGQFSEDMMQLMDVVAYLALSTTKDESGQTAVKRVLLLANQPKFRVKVRTPHAVKVPDTLENPTISALFDILQYK